jgi:hypothetical protein
MIPSAVTTALTCGFSLERVTGIEPALSAWEADVLPLNYTRAAPGPSQPAPRPDIVPEPSGHQATSPGTPTRDGPWGQHQSGSGQGL